MSRTHKRGFARNKDRTYGLSKIIVDILSRIEFPKTTRLHRFTNENDKKRASPKRANPLYLIIEYLSFSFLCHCFLFLGVERLRHRY